MTSKRFSSLSLPATLSIRHDNVWSSPNPLGVSHDENSLEFCGNGKKKTQAYLAFSERHKMPWLAVRASGKPQDFI